MKLLLMTRFRPADSMLPMLIEWQKTPFCSHQKDPQKNKMLGITWAGGNKQKGDGDTCITHRCWSELTTATVIQDQAWLNDKVVITPRL